MDPTLRQSAPMEISGLAYMGLNATSLDDWREYGTDLLGMQVTERGNASLAFRVDDRKQRFVIECADGPPAAYYGWEVPDAAAMERLAARIEAAGVAVTRGTRALAAQRCVTDLIVFADPLGNRVEICHGCAVTEDPFVPGRTISGFRTGPLGLGHAVVTTPDPDAALDFYQGVLGFRLSDYAERPYTLTFLHTNPRHHSLAIVKWDSVGLHHVMLEMFSMDDVGQGWDLAQSQQNLIAAGLGRHLNDSVLSFYTWTPSKFMMEYGWGGLSLDPENWQVAFLEHGFSLWGHDRVWLPPEARALGQRLAREVAERGIRRPVEVVPGNYKLGTGQCPWFDAARAAN